MVEISWRDMAAFWGAGLSTLIFLSQFFPSSPVIHVETGHPTGADLNLRIVNPSKRTVIIREFARCKLKRGQNKIVISRGHEANMNGNEAVGGIWAAIKGEDELICEVYGLNKVIQGCVTRWLIVFLWRGGWPFPIWFPTFVFLSTKRATLLNAANSGHKPQAD
jgi:hypothetical protein